MAKKARVFVTLKRGVLDPQGSAVNRALHAMGFWLEVVTLVIPGFNDSNEELQQLAAVFGMVKTDYVEPVDEKKLITDAISGMVASLDPHSQYFDKKSFKEFREGTSGRFVGAPGADPSEYPPDRAGRRPPPASLPLDRS